MNKKLYKVLSLIGWLLFLLPSVIYFLFPINLHSLEKIVSNLGLLFLAFIFLINYYLSKEGRDTELWWQDITGYIFIVLVFLDFLPRNIIPIARLILFLVFLFLLYVRYKELSAKSKG